MTLQRDYKKRLRIGMVGAGGHTCRNILPTLNFLPVELVGIADLDFDKADAASRQYGALPFLDLTSMARDEELDAVLIAVSPQMHPVLACEAFDLGLHVWLEKPPAMRAADVAKMIEARADRVCVVGFKKAFAPSTRYACDFFESAENGPLSAMSADYPVSIPCGGADILAEGTYTNWLGNGCHPLSLMLAVCGRPIGLTTHANAAGEGALVIEFAGGAIGTLNLANGAGSMSPIERYRFHGKDCTLTIENGRRVTVHRANPMYRYGETESFLESGLAAQVWEPQDAYATLENMPIFTQGIYYELAHFCECVLSGTPATLGTLEYAAQVMTVYEAALVSEGVRVTL